MRPDVLEPGEGAAAAVQSNGPGWGHARAGHDIICISSIDWHDRIWQGHQEIMSALAAQGCRVLYIENTGVRTPTLRDLPRLRQRLRNWWHSTRGFRKEQENLFVYAPCVLPFPYSRLARWINRWWIMRDLRQWMDAMGFDRPVVWTFLPTRLAADLIRAVNPKLAVYYCIDHFAMSSPAARRIAQAEQEMFRLVDTVFVTSHGLYERAAAVARDVHLFPFAVNFNRYEAWRTTHAGRPAPDASAIPRPWIGYVGGLHRWVDQELVGRLAQAHPEWSFVLVGPVQTDVNQLAGQPNVHLLGGKPPEALPAYVANFDVAMIPYVLTPYTQCVYPTKTNEYFAMGKPVVSTPLREILAFNDQHGPLVRVADDARGFAAGIEAALREPPEAAQRRIAVAVENSWQRRIPQMAALIEARIAAKAQERVSNWQRLLAGFFGRLQVRLFKLTVALAFLALVVGQTPVVWWLVEPLRMTAPPRRADAIVVFGGGVGESGQAGQGHEERIQHAVELYRAGYAPRLIISSGYTRVFREAEVMYALAVDQGVPPKAITVDEVSIHTYQNVQSIAALLRAQGASTALVVSSPYHMRRVALVIRRSAPWLEMIPSPVERTRFYAHRRGASLRQIGGLLHEVVGIAYYWLKGWL